MGAIKITMKTDLEETLLMANRYVPIPKSKINAKINSNDRTYRQVDFL
jgi:hypothetical protein